MGRFLGFIGPSYKLSSVNVDCQRCINMYPEINETGSGKEREVAALISTPGLNLLATVGAGPIRGSYYASNDRHFVVSGAKLYEISSTWVATELGTLTTNSGPVSMADTGKRLAIVDGTVNGFFYNFQAATFTTIPFPTEINFKDFNGCPQVITQDGYFIYFNKDTSDCFHSGLVSSIVADDSTIDPLDFFSSEGNPDNVVGTISDHRDVWVFNKKSAEIFFNSGDGDDVFQRIQGAYVEHGCAAPFSIVKMNNTVFWIGADDKGQGIVYMAKGYQPQRISTHAVEFAIQGYANFTDAIAYSYQDRGHFFYVINFPSANTTWVFDSSTNLWHERAFNYQGELRRHRGNTYSFAFGKHVVGDFENGKIYELSNTKFKDDTIPIRRIRIAPHITNGLKLMLFNKFELDIESGTGLDGVGQGVDPQVMLQFSDDGGHTWSNERWSPMGKIGQTKARAIFRRLGYARDRVFKVEISDPVKVVLIGADLEYRPGVS